MKEKFIEEQERLIREAVDAFVDDDYQYQKYLESLGKPVTQEETQANHDAWWDSLTNKQKQKLYEEAERAEEERIERELDDRAWSDEIE